MSDYFYSTDGQARLGPINARQLKQLADEGILAPNTLIWKEGLPDWITADRVKGLFPAPKPAAEPGYGLAPDPTVLAAAGLDAPEPKAWWYLRDGDQTGPITRTALKNLLRNGVIAPGAFVWTEGMSEWRPAQRVPELAGGSPPSRPSPPTAPGRMPTGRPASSGNDPVLRWLVPVGRSGWAVASGYCGLLGLFPMCGLLLSPAALITGIAAIVHLRKRPDLVGMPRAITGIVLGVIGTAVSVLMAVALAADGP